MDVNILIAETDAAGKIARILESLETDSAIRVLRWALDSYRGRSAGDPDAELAPRNLTQPGPLEFSDIAELFAAAGPRRGPEKALVAAYWLQEAGGRPEFDGQTLNNELKHLGHGLPNVTATMNALIALRPQLAIQVRKSGSSQQARKKYRLTREGAVKVQAMIRDSASSA